MTLKYCKMLQIHQRQCYSCAKFMMFLHTFSLLRIYIRICIFSRNNNLLFTINCSNINHIDAIVVAGSIVNSAEKVEGPGTRGAKESVNDSKDEDGSDVASTLSGLLAGLPTLAGPQRLANSLRQKFANNSGESMNRFYVRRMSSGRLAFQVRLSITSVTTIDRRRFANARIIVSKSIAPYNPASD